MVGNVETSSLNGGQSAKEQEIISKVKNVTVLLADPSLIESYFEYWMPCDDDDLKILQSNLEKMPGVEKVSYYDDHKNLIANWTKNPPEFVFNQCDEGYMNQEEWEPHLTTFMDMLSIPYTGPSCDSLVMTKDKGLVRGCALAVGVPAPQEIYFEVDENFEERLPLDMSYPAFPKLGNAAGSMGVLPDSIVNNREECLAKMEQLRTNFPGRPILLQEFLSGREITIAMVGNPELGDFEVFPPLEVDFTKLVDFPRIQTEMKRDAEGLFWKQADTIRANLTEKQIADLKECCRKLFMRMRCRDFCRMDWRMDQHGVFKIMDVNPNCWLGGKFLTSAKFHGYDWPGILKRIVDSCLKRYALKKKQDDEKKRVQAAKAENARKLLKSDA